MWKLHTLKIMIAVPLLLGCVITPALAQSRSQYSDVTTQSTILRDIELFNVSCFPKDSCRQDKVSFSTILEFVLALFVFFFNIFNTNFKFVYFISR
jgi:hypothetical protein